MNDVSHTIEHIIVSVDACGFSSSAMETAISIASRLQADLCGLFVEDSELLELAKLPFTREITLHTRKYRDLSSDSIERNFIVLASQMRHTLEKLAKISDVACSFRTIRGSRLESIIRESEDFQLILMMPTKRLTEHSCHYANISHSRPIVLYYDGSIQARSAVRIIKLLNTDTEMKRLLVLSSFPSVEAEVKEQFPSDGYQVKYQQIESHYIPDLINILKQQPATLVFLPMDDMLFKQHGEFRILQNTLSCPLVLVR